MLLKSSSPKKGHTKASHFCSMEDVLGASNLKLYKAGKIILIKKCVFLQLRLYRCRYLGTQVERGIRCVFIHVCVPVYCFANYNQLKYKIEGVVRPSTCNFESCILCNIDKITLNSMHKTKNKTLLTKYQIVLLFGKPRHTQIKNLLDEQCKNIPLRLYYNYISQYIQ